MLTTIITPLARHGLQALAGYLVAKGYLSEEASAELVGLAISGVTVLWWRAEVWLKARQARKAVEAAIDNAEIHEDIGLADARLRANGQLRD